MEEEGGDAATDETQKLLRGYIIDGNQELKIVEMDKTDFSGEAIISAELNEPLYKIRVLQNVSSGKVLFSSSAFEITNTILSITAELTGNALDGFNSWNTITYTTPTYDSNAQEWTATYTDNGGVINPGGEVCLIVDKTVGVDTVFVGESCSSATSATLTQSYTDSNHGSIARLQADTNTENSVHQLTSNQIYAGARDTIATSLGIGGAFLAAIFIYTFSSILLFNPTTYIFGVTLGLIGSFSIGLINIGWGATMVTFIIIGAIIAFKTNT